MKSFLGQRLLVLTAHPDDESYAIAGTIIKNRQAGGQCFLICATLGERGKSHLKKQVTNAQLKKIREAELKKVARFLAIDKVKVLHWPDTKLANRKRELQRELEKLTKKLHFDSIFSFGPDGLSGHKDHITVGAVAKKIAQRRKVPFVAFGAPPSYYKYRKLISRRRKFGVYTKKWVDFRPNLKIKIDPKQKLQAIKLHQSQYTKNPLAHIPAQVVRDLLNYEYFEI